MGEFWVSIELDDFKCPHDVNALETVTNKLDKKNIANIMYDDIGNTVIISQEMVYQIYYKATKQCKSTDIFSLASFKNDLY